MANPVRLLVTGGRGYADRAEVRRVLATLPSGAVVIEGGAPGADELASFIGRGLGLSVERFDADWQRYGRRAGPIRNQRMLKEGKPTHYYAFPGGRGTADMVRCCERAALPRWTAADR